ncbi:ABC transporter permease [Pseudonocardia spinosispora]|uniref:ABC transporter permease n=1 Tax=Pseudonocardia spinosispora TaxID=103441 RepID=UPI0004050359|nr:ABC transporter permease [Pseudonocardia spinosispora]
MTSTVMDTVAEPTPTQEPRRRSSVVPSALRHGGTLVWRGLVKTTRSPEALIDVTLQPVIFLLLFVYVFGGAIAGDPHTYLQFALPGVLVQSVLFASIGTGVSLCEDRQTGIFDRFRSLPVSRAAPLLGAIGADLIRYLTSGVIMLVVGAALGFRFATGPLPVVAGLAVVIAFAFALCWGFTVLGLLVRDPRSVQGISVMITLPLTFGSTVFVPAATMPWWLRSWAEINPVSQAADALRGLYLGGPVAAPVTSVLVWTALIMGVFAPIAVALYRKRA